ncbi:hypothetical protein [Amycolatopsis magusensis]|uniref:Uncharacterized protein n=1 Tax=Amycolatopsis magusensis TaxID=882444 RepID=A0ABS4Q020_9PSEU|nr:hypothetical protein [Amycolatopsis magusensis]MBP2184448.1 hypothetical protein [Amycolatopsis magusensis]
MSSPPDPDQAARDGYFNHGGHFNVHNHEHFHPGPPRRRALVWLGFVVAAVLVAAVGGYAAWRANSTPADTEPLTAVADYQPDFPYPAAVHPRPLGQQEFPNDQDCRSVVGWAVDQGGAHTSGTTPVRLVLGSRRDTAVVTRIAVRVVERQDAVAGTLFTCGSSGTRPIPLTVDLDATTPIVRAQKSDGTPGEIFAEHNVEEVKQGESRILDLSAQTTRCLCRWVIDVEYVSDGEPRTLTVTPRGQAGFQTTATEAAARRYTALSGSSIWAVG